MKKYKTYIRTAACCMAAAMSMSAPLSAKASPDFAYDQEKWEALRDNVMEYEELGDLVHEYNPAVQNNRVSYQDYYDKDQDDLSNEYFKKAADAADSVRYPEDEDAGYAAKYADAMAAEVTIRRLRQQGIDNLEDGQIKGWTYERTEASTIQNVQRQMITYHQYRLQIIQAEENRKYLEAVYQSTQKKSEAGMATQADILSARQSVQDAETSLAQLNRSLQDTRQSLCVATGWKYDAQPDIRPVPEVKAEDIEALKPTEDKEKAQEANYTLKINQRKLENSQDRATTSQFEIAVRDNEQKINSDIDLAYNAVLQAKVSCDQAEAELEVETRKLEAARRKRAGGTISELQYLQQENAYVQKQVNRELKNMDLLQALETYRWNVKGVGTSV